MPKTFKMKFELQALGDQPYFEDVETNENGEVTSANVANGATDQLVAFTLDYSQNKVLFITSTVEMTLKTNSSGAPDQTLSIGPTSGVVAWSAKCGCVHPITADITALYVSNSAGSNGVLEIYQLSDATV